MAGKGRWTLADLLDFEWMLRSDNERAMSADRAIYRKSVKSSIEGVRDRVEQRRVGLLAYFQERKHGQEKDMPGHKLVTGLKFGSAILATLMFLSGVGVVLGLLQLPEQRYNIGHLLLATLGVQWGLLLLGLVLFFVRRRMTDSLSLAGRLLFWMVKKVSPAGMESWSAVLKGGERYRNVCVWTLAKIGQWAGVGFNLGLIIGLIGVLTFQDVRFFWETTSESEPEQVVQSVVNAVATPWSFAVPQSVPDLNEIKASRLVPEGDLQKGAWPMFFFAALLVWGLLPRLLLWALSLWGVKKSLNTLDFQAPQHRELWRRMSHVERIVETEGQADEAVVIDVGGLGVQLEDISPFLRLRLRVTPIDIHQIGVIDESKEAAAYEALKKARGGVVLLVEDWSLSPKQMTKLHTDIRASVSVDLQIWIVVMGHGEEEEANTEDLVHWKAYVDGLEDAACDVVKFEYVELST